MCRRLDGGRADNAALHDLEGVEKKNANSFDRDDEEKKTARYCKKKLLPQPSILKKMTAATKGGSDREAATQ
jgi:hypothetical protein